MFLSVVTRFERYWKIMAMKQKKHREVSGRFKKRILHVFRLLWQNRQTSWFVRADDVCEQKNRSLATATDEQASVNTSETTSGTTSNSSISQNAEKSTEMFSVHETESIYDKLGEADCIIAIHVM